jgi:hypothetical protein
MGLRGHHEPGLCRGDKGHALPAVALSEHR